MPLFKKRPDTIPPVSAESLSSSRPVKSNASSYVASRDGDSYNANYPRIDHGNDPSLANGYRRNGSVGDVYSRGEAQLDQDRNELFAGYNPAKGGSGRFWDGPSLPDRAPGEETEEDVEGIRKQTRFVKQESVASTRNALRLAREAEETALNTVNRLGDQSGKAMKIFLVLCLQGDIQRDWLTRSVTSTFLKLIPLVPQIGLMN